MKTSLWHKLLLGIALVLTLFLSGYTLAFSVTDIPVFIGAVGLALLFFFIWKKISACTPALEKKLTIFLWILIPTLQFVYICLMQTNMRHDSFWVFTQAVEMLDTHQISPTLYSNYFSQVPNNFGHTIITYWYLCLMKFIGVPSELYMRSVQVFNAIYIDLSLLCIMLSLKKLKGRKSALLFLIFCAITPFPYVWTVYYYTSTSSMFFGCVAVYLWLCIRDLCAKDAASTRKACLLAILLGVLCITGFKVRATTLIAYIAILLYWTLFAKKKQFKKCLPAILSFFIALIVSFLSWKALVAHYAPFDTTDTAFPVTHFIMMGSRRDGSFNEADRVYTASLPTAEAKLEGTISVIKERLTKAGPAGIVKLLLNKQLNVWKEGTDLAQYEFSLSTSFGTLHQLIMGSKNHYFIAFSQMLRVMELFFVCISCVFAFLRKKADGIFLLILNLLGGMAFHLLWETNQTYSIPFTFFFFAVVCDGIERSYNLQFFQKIRGMRVIFSTSLALFLATCIALVSHFGSTTEPQLLDDYVAHQPMFDSDSQVYGIEEGMVLRQSFTTDDPFNLLQVMVETSHESENTSAYLLTLSDESGTRLHEEAFYGADSGYHGYFEFLTAMVTPDGPTTYYMDVQVVQQDEENYLRFLSHSEALEDIFPHGTMTLDGEDTDRDLAFRILNRHLTPLATKKEYCAMAALLILLELFLIFRSVRLIKSSRLVH